MYRCLEPGRRIPLAVRALSFRWALGGGGWASFHIRLPSPSAHLSTILRFTVNSHALSILELPKVLDVVAGFASSDLGAARVRALTPRTDPTWLDREHARVAATRSAIQGDEPWAPGPTPDLTQPLARLRVLGSLWTGVELNAAASLLRTSRRTQAQLRDPNARRSCVPCSRRSLTS